MGEQFLPADPIATCESSSVSLLPMGVIEMPREGLQAGSVPLRKAAELKPAGLRCTASKSTIQESSYRSCWQSPSHFRTRVGLNLRGGFIRVMQVGRKGLGGNTASGSTFEIL